MIPRITRVLKEAGLSSIPSLENESLFDHGLDSLTAALLISELEREFKVKISSDVLSDGKIESISKIQGLIRELGGK